jgi:LysR family hydrogen peroxide-inducible transcriptional activator
MEIKQLQALVAVSQHGSFSAAADMLGTVQSNVSAHIANLEKELGVVLVDRGAGRLTEEGFMAVDRARRILSEVNSLTTDVEALTGEIRGTVRFGVISTTARWIVPRLVDLSKVLHPNVSLVIVESTSTSLEAQLLDGKLDLMVGSFPFLADVDGEALFDEDLLLVVPSNHPLRGRPLVTFAEIDEIELLLPPTGTTFRTEIDDAALAAGVTLKPIVELDGVRLIATLSFEGYAPAILPATALPARLRGDFVKCRVAGLPPRSVGVATRKRERPAAPSRALLQLVRQAAAEGLAGTEGIHPPGQGRPA